MTSLVASNAVIQWPIPGPLRAASFYRVKWIRLTPSFDLSISGSPLTLSWPAIPGQRYDVLATTNLASAFQTVTSIVASSAVIQWPIPARLRGQHLSRKVEPMTPRGPLRGGSPG